MAAAGRGIDVLLVCEQIEQRRVDLAAPIEHAVLLGVADADLRRRGDAMRDCGVGVALSAGVSLKLRIAIRAIDSPSPAVSMRAGLPRAAR